MVPLAPLAHPLAEADLKALARRLRAMTLPPDGPPPHDTAREPPPRAGFFTTTDEPFFVEAGNLLLWGLPLIAGDQASWPLPSWPLSAGTDGGTAILPAPVFPRPFLASFITERDPAEIAAAHRAVAAAPPPRLRFRAAAVANLRLAPVGYPPDACSFSWKLGKFHWLPRA